MASVRIGRYEAAQRLLPPVCMKCGAEATVLKKKTFSWHPSWVLVLLLAGLLPFVIVALVLTKRMTIHAPLCDEHKYHWTWRALFVWLGVAFFVLLGIMCIVLLAALEHQRPGQSNLGGFVCLGFLVAGLAWLIAAAIIGQAGIRPTEITDRSMTLTHVSPTFAQAIREERAMREHEDRSERRPRRRARDDDEYEDDLR